MLWGGCYSCSACWPGAGVYPGCAGQSLASHQVLTQTLSEQETPEGLATNEPMSYPQVNALVFQMTQCPLSSLAITPLTDMRREINSCPLSTSVRPPQREG